MSQLEMQPATRSTRSTGGVIWFLWMVAMWAGFFALLLANSLDELWRWVTQLPVVVEVLLWIAFLPWMLGTWVWTGGWPEGIRVALVLIFAAGWTLVSFPRSREARSKSGA